MGSEALGYSEGKVFCFASSPTQYAGKAGASGPLLKWSGADLKEVVASAVHQQRSPLATQSDIPFSFVITFPFHQHHCAK